MRHKNRLKMLLHGRWISVLTISILLFFSAFFITPAFAAITVTQTDLVSLNQGILPNSITASIIDAGGVDTTDIKSISIYRDYQPAPLIAGDGLFSDSDKLVASVNPSLTNTLTNTFAVGTTLPFYGPTPSYDWYYFIVVETSSTIAHLDAFKGQLTDSIGTGLNSGPLVPSSNTVRCECKVVDIYYAGSDTNLSQTWDLVNGDTEAYWRLNQIPYSIAQEMTEPARLYKLAEALRYSTATDSPAYSNFLKFERRRRLMGMDVKTPVLGIKVAGKNQWQLDVPASTYYDNDYFDTMVIRFNTKGFGTINAHFKAGDGSGSGGQLYPINSSTPASSGVAVYKDTNGNHIFDEGDSAVLNILNPSGSGVSSGWSVDGMTLTLRFSPPASNANAAIPQIVNGGLVDSTRNDTDGVDFFVVLRGDPANMKYGADFTAQVTGMGFWAGANGEAVGAKPPNNSALWYETGEIKAIFELSDYTGTRVDPSSTFPVIGINARHGASSNTLVSFDFYLKATGTNFDPAIDLTDPGVTVLNRSGVVVPTVTSVWLPSADYSGVGLPENWYKTTVSFVSPPTIPSDDINADSGPEYFINLTTSSSFGYKKKIVAAIPNDGVAFGSSKFSASAGTALITNANLDNGSNNRSYPEVDRTTPRNNPLLGNPNVVLSQLDTQIRISSNPTPIIGIDLASNTAPDTQPALKSVVVQVVNTSGFTPVSDLSAMTIFGDTSGIGLWYDLNKNGVFDGAPSDTPLTLVFKPTNTITDGAEGYDRYLMVLRDPLLLDGVGSDSKIFVTLKTSATISAADAL
ncbi:MAG: hypothetical protein NTY10_03540, partial [Candidatus Omnitrophica bacterium]|nr:hypothetical protein [Candidatus Omnitrophota bacterium]